MAPGKAIESQENQSKEHPHDNKKDERRKSPEQRSGHGRKHFQRDLFDELQELLRQ